MLPPRGSASAIRDCGVFVAALGFTGKWNCADARRKAGLAIGVLLRPRDRACGDRELANLLLNWTRGILAPIGAMVRPRDRDCGGRVLLADLFFNWTT